MHAAGLTWEHWKAAQALSQFRGFYVDKEAPSGGRKVMVCGTDFRVIYTAPLLSAADLTEFDTSYKAGFQQVAYVDEMFRYLLNPVSVSGAQLVEVGPQLGRPDLLQLTVVSGDLGDKRTWYQGGVPLVNQPLTTLTPGLLYQAPAGQRDWVNIYSTKLKIQRYNAGQEVIPGSGIWHVGAWQADGTLWPREFYRVKVEVSTDAGATWSDITDNGSYVLDYAAGTLTFNGVQDLSTTVRVSCYQAQTSRFILRPRPGKLMRLTKVEVDKTEGVDWVMTDTILFRIWKGDESYTMDPNDPQYLYVDDDYQSFHQILATATVEHARHEATGGTAPVTPSQRNGWGTNQTRGTAHPTETIRWKFDQPFTLKSSEFMALEVGLENDTPLDAEKSTFSLYVNQENE